MKRRKGLVGGERKRKKGIIEMERIQENRPIESSAEPNFSLADKRQKAKIKPH